MVEDAAIQHATAPVEQDWLIERRKNLSKSKISYERLRTSEKSKVVVEEATYAFLDRLLERGELYFPIVAQYEARGEKPPENIDLILEPLGYILARATVETAVVLGLPENSVAIVLAEPNELEQIGAGATASRGRTNEYGKILLSNSKLFSAFEEMKSFVDEAQEKFLSLQNRGWVEKKASLIDFIRSAYDPKSFPQYAELAKNWLTWKDTGFTYFLMRAIAHEMYHIRQLIIDPQYYEDTLWGARHFLPEKSLSDFQNDLGMYEEYESEREERMQIYDRNIGELSATKFAFRYMFFVARRLVEQKGMSSVSIIDRGLESALRYELPEELKEIRERQASRDVPQTHTDISQAA